MSTQNINGYEIERFTIGDDDYFDMDWLDGSEYKTAKVKGSVIKSLAVGVNIFNSDGTLTGDRILDGDGKSLTFDNLRKLIFNINSAPLGSTGLEMNIQPNGSLIRVRDAGTTDIRFEITQTGNLRLNNEFQFPLVDGNAGQILVTDGAGNLSWSDQSIGDMEKSIYDPDDDGVVLSAEKLMIECINKTGSAVAKGTIVYLKTSSASGTHPEIVLATNTTEIGSSKTIGAVYQNIANDAVGFIVTNGEVDNLNTSAYTIGTRLWLGSTAGSVTTTQPVAPLHSVFIGIVTRSQNTNGRILYSIINGFELSELHDVLIQSPIDGETLTFDGISQLWKNQSLSPALIELDPVINVLNAPPVSPNDGDRYRIGTTPSGLWSGQANNIAQWDATTSTWNFTIPVVDNLVFQTATATTFRFNGSGWAQWAGTPILQNGNNLGVGVDMRIGTNDAGNVWIKAINRNVFWHSQVAFAQRAGGTGLSTYYGTFNLSAVTTNRSWNLPNKNGTFAMLDDIPTIPSQFIPAVSGSNIARFYLWANGLTTLFYSGLNVGAGSGTQSAPVVSGTTATKVIRSRFTGGTTSGSVAGYRGTSQDFFVGSGFLVSFTFGFNDATFNTSAHNWVGLGASTSFQIGSLTYASGLQNIIGVGNDPSDSTLQILHNDGTASATKISLGANFPSNRTSGAAFTGMYCLELYNALNDSTSIKWRITRIDTGDVQTGTITTNIPANNIGLCPVISRSNGTSSSIAAVIDVGNFLAYTLF